jgi:hypothetical protein
MTNWKDKRNGRAKKWTDDPSLLESEILQIKSDQQYDLNAAKIIMRLYWNMPIAARDLPTVNTAADMGRYNEAVNALVGQIGFNCLRDLIDAMGARICKQMSCKVITVGGNVDLFQQATKMSRLLDGIFEENKAREVFESAFVDTCAGRGFGAVKTSFDPAAKKVLFSHVDSMNVFFRINEGRTPSNLFTISYVPREYLQDSYPKIADDIEGVPRAAIDWIVGVDSPGTTSEDTVAVYEGWKLARGEVKGRWAMTCGKGIVLEDEVYDFDFHQISLFRVFHEHQGAGGVALGRIGAPYHRWENQLVRIAAASLGGAVPRIVKHALTTVNGGGFSEMPYSITEWEGQIEPKVESSNPVSEQVLKMIPSVRHQAHADTGVNENMASGVKPTGIESGAAFREFKEFADTRMNGPHERWSCLWSDVGKATLGTCSANYKNETITIKAAGSSALLEIKWREVNMVRDKYCLKFSATSGLSSSVPGRMQGVQDLQALGGIDNIESMRLIANVVPDIAATVDRITAPRDLAIHQCEEALSGNPQQPSPMCGMEYLTDCVRIGSQLWAKAMLNGNYTPEQMECLRKFIKAAKRKQTPPLPKITMAAPAAPMAPGMVVPVGMSPQAVAHNQYEARSLGIGLPAEQPAPAAEPASVPPTE